MVLLTHPMLQRTTITLALVSLLALVGCGNIEEVDTGTGSTDTIVIRNYAFLPETITAPPGGEIFFYNLDEVPHRILSQSDNDAFDNTGDFDTLIIPSGEIGFVSISDTAESGTQIHFYDDFLEAAMATPNGVVTVE